MTDTPQTPIAIIGRGCVLPGCLTPDALWDAVVQNKSLITPPPENIWGLSDREAAKLSYPGGYVSGFADAFDASTFEPLGAATLDPVFQWPLKAAQDAWIEAERPEAPNGRTAVILANLSYPSRAKADYAGDIWLNGHSDIDPRNAFNSGLPSSLIMQSIDATGPAFSLDAACASSLYALHIACRKLRHGTIDVALVGAVNASDNLMLHKGFEALRALSPSGQSRPFSTSADGLIPAEGAAAVVLKRLADVSKSEKIFGLILGTGLSNDGRRRGLLAPDEDGQLEAMKRAYAAAKIHPDTIGYLECHATGTPVGDGVEIRSAARLFKDRSALPVGSLKSNTGHLITAAGMASLLKMTSAFEHKTLPPTRLSDTAIDAFDTTCMTPHRTATPWHADAPRRAAISNFGFGGNNAHLILEEPPKNRARQQTAPSLRASQHTISICGIGALAGPDRGGNRIVRRLMSPPLQRQGRSETLPLNPAFARVPPADLKQAEAQQLAVLDTSEEALANIELGPLHRVGVFTGMGCAADSARWLLRERLDARLGETLDKPDLDQRKDQIAAPIESADVLGAMPNMPANRLNAAVDLRGQGFTISAEEQTGRTVLALALEALQAGEIDLAIVAAADFATEPVRAQALATSGQTTVPADLAACLILKRRSDLSESEVEYATVASAKAFGVDHHAYKLIETVYGRAPIADDLFHLAAAALLARKGHRIGPEPYSKPRVTKAPPTYGAWQLTEAATSGDPLRPAPHMYWAAAKSKKALAARIERNKTGGAGTARIAIHASSADSLAKRQRIAQMALQAGQVPASEGITFGSGKATGEMAFVFTGSAAAYPRMGRGLFMAFPDLSARMGDAFPEAARIAHLLSKPELSAYEQLCAVTLLSQVQTLLLRDMLGLKPDAVMGLSLGETNALIAFKFWKDAGYLLDEIAADEMYERHLGGAFETAREAWGLDHPAKWTNWHIYAPIAAVEKAIPEGSNVEITIIYSPEDCVIGGPPDACKAVAARLGAGSGMAMNQHLIVHANAMTPYADTWRRLHTRPTSAKPDVRLYSNAGNAAYKPTKAKVASVLTRQAISPINFPATVKQAYQDGVRTFVEIGPRDTLSQGIAKTLGQKPHLAIPADRIDMSDLGQITALSCALFADGRSPDMAKVSATLEAARKTGWSHASGPSPKLTHPAHLPAPRLDPITDTEAPMTDRAIMPVAPSLARPNFGTLVADIPQRAPAPNSIPTSKLALPPFPPTGPSFARPQIEKASTGLISDLFGEAFSRQDQYRRQVRLPNPPLLLVDRITGIDAAPLTEGKGRIWTETDVNEDAWYMHEGFMRPGPLIEAGQADLSLISWMGADLKNCDERVYRLLGCELTLHDGGLPRAGDTLKYQIEITGHATLSGVRMFFFQYDCYTNGRRLFSVRNGQAGFFTDDELAAGKGVLWSAQKSAPPTAAPAPFTPQTVSQKTSFSPNDLAKFRTGDAYACFGEGFEACAPHTNPPYIPDAQLALFDHVSIFAPNGGPWKRGYLKAHAHVPTDAWFYDGHFHEDPCMPGTLMAEAAVQALEFYAAAIGLTIACDGFTIEPVSDETFKFVCRGQVIPDMPHDLEYEIFIDEIIDGDTPVLFAALLATSDGKKVFYCPRFGIRLRRNWPVVPAGTIKTPIGPQGESRGDWAALQACGDGAPSDAFGAMYKPFDTAGRVPRLPQPPYHFISRVLSISTRPNAPEDGATVVTEYDVPDDAWYFADNANGKMPFAVLVEVVLQPCGWLASHGGFALNGGECFRNLDGNGHVLREIGPGDGPIRVTSKMTRFSRAGPMTIVFFELTATLPDGEIVMTLETSFGFFPLDALVRQAGLKTTDAQRAFLALPETPQIINEGQSLLPDGRMRMLDRVDYFDPSGGEARLGLIRGQQDIDPYAWYFKAHFYQDPVQPGSLGLDAMVQLLKRAAILKGLALDDSTLRFESTATGEPVSWSYRGQVTPIRKRVTTIIEITSIVDAGDTQLITARGSLWCDALRIYEANDLSIRLVPKAP